MKIYKQIINNSPDVVCVDFFDTLVERKLSPLYSSLKWSRNIIEYFGLNIELSEMLGYRLNHIETCDKSYAESIKNLLLYLSMYKNINIDFAEFFEKSKEIDFGVEKDSIVLKKGMLSTLNKLKHLGKKLVLVTDFYLDNDFYEMILNHLNLSNIFDNVIVSSAYSKTKSDGSLYEIVKEKYPNKKIVMVGDNKKSDVIQSNKQGLIGIKCNSIFSKLKYFVRNIKIDKICLKNYKAIYKIKTKSKLVSNYAFSLYDFCERLYKKCISENIPCLNFLSREGQFLKLLFEEYQKDKFKKIETNYLCVSRYSSFLPSLYGMPFCKETLHNLFNNYKNITVREFFTNLQLTDDEISSLKQDKIDVVINNFADSTVFEQLKNNTDFLNIINKKIKQSYDNFTTYFNHVTKGQNKIYLVDVGWKGTMQNNLVQIFKEKEFVGLYLGLDSLNVLDIKNKKYGILWHIDKNAYFINHINYEYILKADHGKVETYENGQPEFKNDGDVEIYNKMVKNIQRDLLYKFQLIKRARNNDLIYRHKNSTFIDLHKKLIKTKKNDLIKMEYKIWLYHNENFGNITDMIGSNSKTKFFKWSLKKRLQYRINNIKYSNLG